MAIDETTSKPVQAEAISLLPLPQDALIIRPYPKIIIYYPTMIAAVICGFLAMSLQSRPMALEFIAVAFFTIFLVNTVIVTLDFPNWAAFAAILLILLVLAVLVILYLLNVNAFAWIGQAILGLHAAANHRFYFVFAAVFTFAFFLAWLVTRFDYWVVSNNEVFHYQAPYGNLERAPAPNLRFEKQISDVFEYWFFRSCNFKAAFGPRFAG